MSNTGRISKAEEDILTAIGYLVMRWNYAEHFARQILRQYLPGTSLGDPDHLQLSGRPAAWIENQLQSEVLPLWKDPGRSYLERLILAYSRAREHRNHLVHGIYMTADAGGPYPAVAVLIPTRPTNRKVEVPSHATLGDIHPLADYFHDLAMFARDVSVGFAKDGALATNPDGTPVLTELDRLIQPLEPRKYEVI